MTVQSIRIITFSPTHSSLNAAKAVASAFDCPVEVEDITTSWREPHSSPFSPGELLIASVPVYGGRIPAFVEPYLRSLQGNGAAACPVVVYGNRAYEDALLELGDILAGDGFLPVAGAVFVAGHSMTAKVATGRPSKEELAEGKAFGEQLKAKLAKDDLSRPEIPGNRPYKERKPSGGDPMYPATKENCIGCGICAKGCPMQIISREDFCTIIAPENCIRCCACVKNCPAGAKHFDSPAFAALQQMMEENFVGEHQPEFYL